jgi:NTE family protein
LIKWRCSLPLAQVNQLRGTLGGWNCRDVQFFVDVIGFDELGPERAKELSSIDTRFVLPRQHVDMAVEAGREALRKNNTFRKFLASMQGRPVRPRPPPATPVAQSQVQAVGEPPEPAAIILPTGTR